MTMATRLSINNCAKTFPDGTHALLPTTLTVDPGRILALLGPSGCGKTTMLRIIAGLEKPDAGGSVCFDQDDVTAKPIEQRSVGMVFQSYALFPNMNVRANIGYGLRVKGLPKAEIAARVEEVISFCRLEGLERRSASQLSGGQRQRVALARAVAPRPRVLLMDEPLSALDAALRDSLRDELADMLRRLSITAVFVTHDQSEAMAIADLIAVMQAGVIQQVDAPETLYGQPETAFVATFIGGANQLDGTVVDGMLMLEGGKLDIGGRNLTGRSVFVRSEHIRLVNPVGATLTGTVTSRIFLGDHVKLRLEGVCGSPITVKTSGSVVPALEERVGLDIDYRALILTPR